MLYDSHAHLDHDEYTEEQRSKVIQAVEASDLAYVNDIGFDLPSSRLAAAHGATYPWCFAAVGCHPHNAKDMDEDMLVEIKALAGEKNVRAIGEIGLDFHYDISERDVQREWFRRQIRLANELHMPIVIHSREAEAECMEILREEGAFSDERKSWFPKRMGTDGSESPDARVLIHCFSGSRETARRYVDLGATISLAGPLTFKNNRKTREVAEDISIAFLLAETDSPFLTPEPFRGRANIPPYVEFTIKKLAEIKGMPWEEVAEITCRNAKVFFDVD